MTTTALDYADDEDGEDDELARRREHLLMRRTTVMFMRNAGSTWPTIAAEVGVSEATCRKDYAVVCRDINAEQPANIVARHRAVMFDIHVLRHRLAALGRHVDHHLDCVRHSTHAQEPPGLIGSTASIAAQSRGLIRLW